MNTRESELAAEVQAQAEELAELRAAISETCTLLGHEGQDADDLRDAVGQLERLVEGKDRDGVPLTGLAGRLRQRLYWPTDLQLADLLKTRAVDAAINERFLSAVPGVLRPRVAPPLSEWIRVVVTALELSK